MQCPSCRLPKSLYLMHPVPDGQLHTGKAENCNSPGYKNVTRCWKYRNQLLFDGNRGWGGVPVEYGNLPSSIPERYLKFT